MSTLPRLAAVTVALILLSMVRAEGAELAVHDVTMLSGETTGIVVSGGVAGEWTFGVNIMVEIVPRAGAVGIVQFTPAPPVDIVQLGDPWPEVGTFTPIDTDFSYSDLRNGSVDDDGVFVPAPVTFSGNLARYPVIASDDARGVWDLVLSTSVGDSNWQGLPTMLTAGTLTVASAHGIPAISAWGQVIMALLLATAATATVSRRRRTCENSPARHEVRQ